jgi:hypothetical protein
MTTRDDLFARARRPNTTFHDFGAHVLDEYAENDEELESLRVELYEAKLAEVTARVDDDDGDALPAFLEDLVRLGSPPPVECYASIETWRAGIVNWLRQRGVESWTNLCQMTPPRTVVPKCGRLAGQKVSRRNATFLTPAEVLRRRTLMRASQALFDILMPKPSTPKELPPPAVLLEIAAELRRLKGVEQVEADEPAPMAAEIRDQPTTPPAAPATIERWRVEIHIPHSTLRRYCEDNGVDTAGPIALDDLQKVLDAMDKSKRSNARKNAAKTREELLRP